MAEPKTLEELANEAFPPAIPKIFTLGLIAGTIYWFVFEASKRKRK